MSFREKSAWISLISILLVSGFFFMHVPWTLTPSSSLALVHALLLCVIALVVIEVVAHIVVAIRAPEDAHAPKDERERLIALKAFARRTTCMWSARSSRSIRSTSAQLAWRWATSSCSLSSSGRS